MQWRALDSAIGRIRRGIADDPRAARQEIRELLKSAGPTARVRLWGLEIVACSYMGRFEEGLRAYAAGRKLRGSVLARAELEASLAGLHIDRGDLEEATAAADRAVSLIRPEALATTPRSKRMERSIRTMYGAALIVRAQAGALPGSPRPSTVGDVLEAFPWIDPRYAMHVHLAAVSTLATLLTTRATTPEDLRTALRLEEEAQRLLRRRRVRACHPHRAQLRGIRALVLAKLGAVSRAEEVMAHRVIPDLRAAGLDSAADQMGEFLLWIVAERAGQEGRARYLRRKLGLPATPPETARGPKTAKDGDDWSGW